MIEKYKIECCPTTGLSYLSDPFEVYFHRKQSMQEFVEILPGSYSTKHYKRSHDGSWNCIGHTSLKGSNNQK